MKSVEDEEDEVLEPPRKKMKVKKPSKIEKGECPSCFQKLPMKTLIKHATTCWGPREKIFQKNTVLPIILGMYQETRPAI